jgi:hypothetical protein
MDPPGSQNGFFEPGWSNMKSDHSTKPGRVHIWKLQYSTHSRALERLFDSIFDVGRLDLRFNLNFISHGNDSH